MKSPRPLIQTSNLRHTMMKNPYKPGMTAAAARWSTPKRQRIETSKGGALDTPGSPHPHRHVINPFPQEEHEDPPLPSEIVSLNLPSFDVKSMPAPPTSEAFLHPKVTEENCDGGRSMNFHLKPRTGTTSRNDKPLILDDLFGGIVLQ